MIMMKMHKKIREIRKNLDIMENTMFIYNYL